MRSRGLLGRGFRVQQMPMCSGKALRQQLLALLGALAAGALGAAEELGEIAVAVALCVLDVGLEPENVAQALLGEPDDVVVLVLGSRELSRLGGCCVCHFAPPSVGFGSRLPRRRRD